MSPSELDLDALFDSDFTNSEAIVLDPSVFTSSVSDESDEETSTTYLPEVPAINASLAAEVPRTEVIEIVRKTSGDGSKKTRGGQTATCIARCDIVRNIFAEAAKTGDVLNTTIVMERASGTDVKYTDVILVSKQLKAAGKITETLKGRQAHWTAVV